MSAGFKATTSVLLLLCVATVFCQGPDASECEVCRERYMTWFTSKVINSSIWADNNTKLTADDLCSEAQDIYYNCFMTCVIDPNGHRIAHTEDRNAKTLKSFLFQSCQQHECRLADTLACSRGARRHSCLPESLECSLKQLSETGCNPVRLCHEAERQAYITNTKERITCYTTYPDFVPDDVPQNSDIRRGYQVCKDVVLVGCLENWHKEKSLQDFSRFVEYSDEFQQEICSREVYERALTCLEGAINGTVTYEGQEYTKPCDLAFMKDFHQFMFRNGVTDLLFAYDYMCSPYYNCSANATAGDLPSEPELIDEESETPEEETPAESTEETKEDKMAETKESDDTAAPEKAESTDDHSDHSDHSDHKHPGPSQKGATGKSMDDGSSASYLTSSLHLLCLVIFYQYLSC